MLGMNKSLLQYQVPGLVKVLFMKIGKRSLTEIKTFFPNFDKFSYMINQRL